MKTPSAPARHGRSPKLRSLPLPAVPFKVFIGYADVPAVRRATMTVADAVRASGRAFDVQPMLWRFEQLASAHWGSRAIRAALDADVVVLASSAPGALAPAIEDWVNGFLAANRGRRATIVAVSGTSDAWTISIEEPAVKRPAAGSGPKMPALDSANRRSLVTAQS